MVLPWRRATRRITRSAYVSSSLTPKITSRTTIAAEITSAASNADPNESTLIVRELMWEASIRIRASSTSTVTKPSASVNGRRSAATTGGSTAFSAAIRTAAAAASENVPTVRPGRIAAAMNTETAATSQESSTCSSRNRGACGFQVIVSPYDWLLSVTTGIDNCAFLRDCRHPDRRMGGDTITRIG